MTDIGLDVSQVVLTSYFCWRLIAVATLQIWRQIQINLASYNGNLIVFCDLTIFSKQMNFSSSLSSSKMSSNSVNISLSFDANKLESVIKLGYHQLSAIFLRRLVGWNLQLILIWGYLTVQCNVLKAYHWWNFCEKFLWCKLVNSTKMFVILH